MTTTVIGAFDSTRSVRQVMEALVEAGFPGEDIEIVGGSEDEIVAEITDRGFGEEDAREFAETAESGKTLVAARVPEAKVDRVVAIMDRYEGPEGEAGKGAGRERRGNGGETVPVVEEELAVGKRKVVRGGIRVTSKVSERPVEETVRLREERVKAERQPVDRELSPEEAEAAFEERTVEMTETAEEAAITKEARVVEEVSLSKLAKEREETVRDKVRRTEVEVEEMGARSRKAR